MKPVQKRKPAPYRWHGCWELEKREAIARCRWFIAYERLTTSEFHGIASGYAGGGTFECEEFFVRIEQGKIASCVMDGTDRLTSKPVSMSALERRHRHHFNPELAFYSIFEEFNFGWGYDVQYLAPEAIETFELMAQDEDEEFPGEFDIVGGTASDSWVKSLLGDYFGITASPTVLQRRMSRAEREARKVKAREWSPRLARKARKLMKTWEAR